MLGLVQPNSRGSKSDYLDWIFPVLLKLYLLKFDNVHKTVKPEARRAMSTSKDPVICSFILRNVDQFICAYGNDAPNVDCPPTSHPGFHTL
ncbi:hypothetical protein VP01_4413g2, partial [Puccinia sorghi]